MPENKARHGLRTASLHLCATAIIAIVGGAMSMAADPSIAGPDPVDEGKQMNAVETVLPAAGFALAAENVDVNPGSHISLTVTADRPYAASAVQSEVDVVVPVPLGSCIACRAELASDGAPLMTFSFDLDGEQLRFYDQWDAPEARLPGPSTPVFSFYSGTVAGEAFFYVVTARETVVALSIDVDGNGTYEPIEVVRVGDPMRLDDGRMLYAHRIAVHAVPFVSWEVAFDDGRAGTAHGTANLAKERALKGEATLPSNDGPVTVYFEMARTSDVHVMDIPVSAFRPVFEYTARPAGSSDSSGFVSLGSEPAEPRIKALAVEHASTSSLGSPSAASLKRTSTGDGPIDGDAANADTGSSFRARAAALASRAADMAGSVPPWALALGAAGLVTLIGVTVFRRTRPRMRGRLESAGQRGAHR